MRQSRFAGRKKIAQHEAAGVLGRLWFESRVPLCGTALLREDVSPSALKRCLTILTVTHITTKPCRSWCNELLRERLMPTVSQLKNLLVVIACVVAAYLSYMFFGGYLQSVLN